MSKFTTKKILKFLLDEEYKIIKNKNSHIVIKLWNEKKKDIIHVPLEDELHTVELKKMLGEDLLNKFLGKNQYD